MVLLPGAIVGPYGQQSTSGARGPLLRTERAVAP
eukprot:SAG22_NODE_11346_length_489_cov_1.310256_1_plen_33_part_10